MYPQYRPAPYRPRPNYALRRLLAATGAILAVLLVVNLFGRVFGGGGGDDESAVESTGDDTTQDEPTDAADIVPALEEPPACAVGDEPTIYARPQDWYRTLVDPLEALPADYVPPDLVSASEANYAAEYQIRSFLATDLNSMRNGIIEAELPEVALIAAYRSAEQQGALYAQREADLGPEAAAEGVARAGHSEHQLGTTIDVRPIGASDVDQSFGDTPTGQWLEANSWRYGFILSYPRGKEEVTCYKYEPWHFRYVGPDLALRINDSGLTLREYLYHWETIGSEPGYAPSAASDLPLPTVVAPTDTDPATSGDGDPASGAETSEEPLE